MELVYKHVQTMQKASLKNTVWTKPALTHKNTYITSVLPRVRKEGVQVDLYLLFLGVELALHSVNATN